MQRRPALVVGLVHSGTLLHQEANDVQVLVYAGLRTGQACQLSSQPDAHQETETSLPRQTRGPRASEGCGKQCWTAFNGSPRASGHPGNSMCGSPEHEEFMETGAGSRARIKEWAWGMRGGAAIPAMTAEHSLQMEEPRAHTWSPKDKRREQTPQHRWWQTAHLALSPIHSTRKDCHHKRHECSALQRQS